MRDPCSHEFDSDGCCLNCQLTYDEVYGPNYCEEREADRLFEARREIEVFDED